MSSNSINVNVGGTTFLTAVHTLISNSTYFASLLCGHWSESSADNGEGNIFIDQNPIDFGKLLDYMHHGKIKLKDVDSNVLILTNYLGLERLLLAVKVRWYCNIGK